MQDKYLVFIIQAYDERDKATRMLTDTVTMELIAENEEEAMNRAKSLVKRNHYRVASIIEKYHDNTK